MDEIKIDNATILKRNDDDFLFTEVDGEMVVMHTESGKYLGLNPVSKDIWEMMENAIAYEDIIAKLLEAYDIERATCEEDTSNVIKTMIKIKMAAIQS